MHVMKLKRNWLTCDYQKYNNYYYMNIRIPRCIVVVKTGQCKKLISFVSQSYDHLVLA